MRVCKVSTLVSVHTLGDWHQSIIHDLCRAPVPDTKDAGAGAERVSRFWDSRFPAARGDTGSDPAVGSGSLARERISDRVFYCTNCLFLSPE